MANVFKPLGDLNKLTGGRNFSSGQQAFGAVASTIAPAIGSTLSFGYDAGGAGSAVSNLGSQVGSALSSVNPVLGGIVSLGSGLIGGGINALFGQKKNEANRATFNSSINTLNSFTGDASSVESLQDSLDSLGPLYNINSSLTGSDGLFSHKNRDYADILKRELTAGLNRALFAANNNMSNLNKEEVRNFNRSFYAEGGPIEKISEPKNKNHTNGSIFPSPFDVVENGDSHEENSNGGVQVGVDLNGTPNLVEEGEVIIDNQFVLSDREEVPEEDKKRLGFGGGKHATYADLGKTLKKFYEERYDEISKRTLDHHLNFLAESLERKKEADAKAELETELEAQGIDPEEYYAALEEQQALQELIAADLAMQLLMAMLQGGLPMIAAYGGSIHIDPSKRGTFTAAAKRHGKSVLEFASQVLANKDNYSSAMVKKANFARNAAKWHDLGGALNNYYRGANVYGNGTSNMLDWIDKNFSIILPILQNDDNYREEEVLFTKPSLDLVKAKVAEESRKAYERAAEMSSLRETAKDPLGPESLISSGVPIRPHKFNQSDIANSVDAEDIAALKLKAEPLERTSPKLAPFAYSRFTPVATSLGQYIAGLFDRPSLLRTSAIDLAIGRLRPMRPARISDYEVPKHVDYMTAINQLQGANAALRRSLLNLGNALSALAGTIASDYNLQNSIGTAMANIDKENYTRDRAALEFNKDTNTKNAQFLQEARLHNLGVNSAIANLMVLRGQAAEDAYNNYWNRQSQRLDNFALNLGNLGREAFSMNMALTNPSLLYYLDNFGRVGYKGYDRNGNPIFG